MVYFQRSMSQGKTDADLFFHDAKINVLFAVRNNRALIMRKLWIT